MPANAGIQTATWYSADEKNRPQIGREAAANEGSPNRYGA
jgi:hypothetical protein